MFSSSVGRAENTLTKTLSLERGVLDMTVAVANTLTCNIYHGGHDMTQLYILPMNIQGYVL